MKPRSLKLGKHRVVIADVLPFECPLTFSNYYFYKFLSDHKVEIKNSRLSWQAGGPGLEAAMRILFGKPVEGISWNGRISSTRLKPKAKLIPFDFRIAHKGNRFRELSVIHPRSQMELVEFYDANKYLILYYCNRSRSSIRRPVKVARYTSRAKTSENKKQKVGFPTSLRSFFVYEEFGNIQAFFESRLYHRCEKQYSRLFKFDISQCFDSIYSHSITWALLNKDVVKANLEPSTSTFGGAFDQLMQNLNYGETNGIVVGPEFSRLFAELILQRIDEDVISLLSNQFNLIYGIDYETFRYVDDFFVFHNSETSRETILEAFRLELRKFKLNLNDSKFAIYEKPLITELTIAKQKIAFMLEHYIRFDPSSNGKNIAEPDKDELPSVPLSYSEYYVTTNTPITAFKTILKQTGIGYEDILHFTLGHIDARFEELIASYRDQEKDSHLERKFVETLLSILDFVFFLYTVKPRVNTTIKLCRILQKITKLVSDKEIVNIDHKHLIFKSIYQNVAFILNRNRATKHTPVETLYLLTALGEFGREYWLDAEILQLYLNITEDDCGNLHYEGTMNYFTITVILFYIKNKKRYSRLSEFLQNHIYHRFKTERGSISTSAELVFLFFDTISCPYLTRQFKDKIMKLMELSRRERETLPGLQTNWFTKWTDFDLKSALDSKVSSEVY